MDYRDWGYGDRAPYERRPSTSWVDRAEARAAGDGLAPDSPWDAYLGSSWGESTAATPSSDGVDSIIAEVDDAYWTPPSSTALPIPRQRGRHRDDREDDALAPSPVSGPLGGGFSGSAVAPTSGPALAGPTSLTGRSGSGGPAPSVAGFGRYAGSTFGRPIADDPVSARPVSSGPISAGPVSSGPVGPVSAGPVSSGPVGPVSAGAGASRPTSGGWRPSDPDAGWSRRPVDTGDWRSLPEPDEWRRSDDTGEWIRSGHTGEWRNPQARSWSEPAESDASVRAPRARDWRDDTSTGEWRRAAHTGQFERVTDAGWDEAANWAATSGATGYQESGPERWGGPSYGRQRRSMVETESSWRDSGETFWSGTRLAGDDPRWVETPSSAPRSPAVAYPRPARPRATPAPPRPSYRPTARRGRNDRLDEELLGFNPGGYVASLVYTALWFAVPVLVFTLWIFTLDNTPPPPGCVTDVTGGGCQSERAEAISSLIGGAPQFGAAFLASLVVAIVVRRASGSWRAASVGLASAVVGGGLSTVLFTALGS